MSRQILEQKINEILDGVIMLESMVEQAMLSAVKSLVDKDIEASRRIYKADDAINTKRYQLESETISVIARQQPVAVDVRVLTSVLEVITELERMGDYAKGIANINIKIGSEPFIKPLIDIPKMADVTADMLRRGIKAFVEKDEKAARSIPAEDDRVDELYYAVYSELIAVMSKDPSTVDQANYLLWVAHNIERTADRVTNICERTLYIITGDLADIDVSDDELRQETA